MQTTSEATLKRFEELARTDSVVAPLALLQVQVLRAAARDEWERSVPPFERESLLRGYPLLHQQTLAVDSDQLLGLLQSLVDTSIRSGTPSASKLRAALKGRAFDVPALIASSIQQVDGAFVDAGAGSALLRTLVNLATHPLLRACGRRAETLVQSASWNAGFCPLCAAYPLLAELRGLDRQRWLRCGRCASAWPGGPQRCVYCGNEDYQTLGYLAPEREREARQAATCDRCQGYLKTLTVFAELSPAELAMQDLLTLELDLASLDRGYARPQQPAFPLSVNVVPAGRISNARR